MNNTYRKMNREIGTHRTRAMSSYCKIKSQTQWIRGMCTGICGTRNWTSGQGFKGRPKKETSCRVFEMSSVDAMEQLAWSDDGTLDSPSVAFG